MPVAGFPGRRNWSYGVSLFASDSCYGRPDNLKSLVQAAHARGLMVLLGVVYNHFGSEGNYLHPGFGSSYLRALYWLEGHHLNGLRLEPFMLA